MGYKKLEQDTVEKKHISANNGVVYRANVVTSVVTNVVTNVDEVFIEKYMNR